MRSHCPRWLLALALSGATLVVAAPAAAHIQVLPERVAPADPVLFSVLVPGESSSGTSKVDLKVPAGVYPFSYEEIPGWKRKLIKKPNGLIDRIVWTGRAAPDGLVRFTFLAGTPEKSGEIKWGAIQTYADGQEALWIGSPESDNPAPVTVVSESVQRQNAGGEGGGADEETIVASNPDRSDSGGDTDLPLTIAALLGFFFGLSSLVILFVNRRKPKGNTKTPGRR
jgi:uncharacterized protein YcnI